MRRTASLSALLLQLAWSTAIPVLHAETEVFSSRVAVEGDHSTACTRLDDPAHGSTCSALAAALTGTPRYLLPCLGGGDAVLAPAIDLPSRSAGLFALHLARSPPSVH